MKIKFDKQVSYAKFHSPLNNFELDSQEIEHRLDPLTGFSSVVRTGRKFWQHLYDTDEKQLAEIIEQTRGRCFFCPEKVNEATPKFTKEMFPDGRIQRGETVVFPNLFAQKEHSAIAVICREHYLSLDEFSPGILANAFKASLIYIKRLYEVESPKFAEIGFNYLFPAGASISHPHLQLLASDVPYFLIADLLEHSQDFYEKQSVNYWQELVEAEKETGERYLNSIGNTDWFVPFAPMREDEVHGLVRNRSNFLEFDDSDWDNLAEGISRVFKFYKDKGLSSCNFALCSGPLDEKLDYLWAGVRIVSRCSVQARPVNDVWYSQNIFYDGLITEPPEEIAVSLRNYF